MTLFLASHFSEVAGLFVEFVNNRQRGKTVTFIPTAANLETDPFYVSEDLQTLEKLGMTVDVLDISHEGRETIQHKLENGDYLFVSGGNTFYLLQELKRTGTDKLLVDHIEKGKPYIGSSAGSVILANSIEYVSKMDDSSQAPLLADYRSLGVIDFYPLPHYGNSYFSETVDTILREYRSTLNLRVLSDKQAIQVTKDGSELKELGSPEA